MNPTTTTRREFEDLVVADACDHNTPVTAAWLRSDEKVVEFFATLIVLIARIDDQLARDKIRPSVDRSWRGRALGLQSRLRARLAEIKPLAKEAQRRANGATQ